MQLAKAIRTGPNLKGKFFQPAPAHTPESTRTCSARVRRTQKKTTGDKCVAPPGHTHDTQHTGHEPLLPETPDAGYGPASGAAGGLHLVTMYAGSVGRKPKLRACA